MNTFIILNFRKMKERNFYEDREIYSVALFFLFGKRQ